MNKIFQMIAILSGLMFYGAIADAKLNIFPQPRYIPALTFFSPDGKTHRLSDFDADLLMAVVWSRSCGPCIAELQNLNDFANKMKNRGIQVILISPEKEWKTMEERRLFMQRYGAPDLVNYLDRRGSFFDGMGIRSTPTAILVNRNHEEVGQITGNVKWDDPDVERYMLKLKKKSSEELNKGKSANQKQ